MGISVFQTQADKAFANPCVCHGFGHEAADAAFRHVVFQRDNAMLHAADMIKQIKPEVFLEVDGGVDDQTAEAVVKAGATVLVAGNYVFGNGNMAEAIDVLRKKSRRFPS